jgi:hypothetical protein
MDDIIIDSNLYVDHKKSYGPGLQSVFRALAQAGPDGLTDQGVARTLQMKHKTTSARRVELTRWGYVYPVGMVKEVRQRARIWALTPAGIAEAISRGFYGIQGD